MSVDQTTGVHKCPECGRRQHAEIIGIDLDGRLLRCKRCGSRFRPLTAAEAARRERERKRRWREEHPEYAREYKRKRRAEDPELAREKDRAYASRHRDRITELNRAWRAAHAEQEQGQEDDRNRRQPAVQRGCRRREDDPGVQEGGGTVSEYIIDTTTHLLDFCAWGERKDGAE